MRSMFGCRTVALLLASVTPMPLMAQEALSQNAASGQDKPLPAEDPGDELVNDIVVTGQREAQRAARAVKREAFAISDVVSSDDIGKLPDHNTAAALRRIPGVSVQEDQGEPRFPVLRGLSSTYNRTTVDGAIVAGVDETGRTVPLDIVPSVMAGRIEVIKTVTPENDANAVGGIINIETRSAFDAKRSIFFNGIGSYGIYEQNGDVRNDKPSLRFAFAAGARFGADEQWGIVLGASYEQLDYDIPQVESATPSVREYARAGIAGTAANVPVNSGDPRGNGIQVPTQLRLFWYNNTKERAGANAKLEYRRDAFRWVLSGIFARTEDDEERIEFRTEPLTAGVLADVLDQTPTTGRFAGGRNIIQLNQPITKRRIIIGRTAAEWAPGDRLKINGDAIYSQGRLRVPNESIEFRTRDAQATNYAFTYDTSDFFPIFNPINPTANRNPANFFLQQQRDAETRTLEKSGQFRLNAAYDVSDLVKLKAGGVYRTTRRNFANRQTDYTAGTGFTYSLDEVDVPGPDELIQGRYLLTPRIGVDAYQAFFSANQARFTTTTRPNGGDYRVDEDVTAGYGQGSVKLGPLTLLAGLRYERTEVESDGIRTQGTTLTPVRTGASYDNWLPGVHARFDVNSQVVFRAAYTNTIGRPDFGSIAASQNLTFDGSQARLTRGNPELRPRRSRGFDLSFEFYPRDGLISMAVFSKSLRDEIFTLTSTETVDIGRGAETVIVTTPQNADDARIRGVEMAVQQALTFLPDPLNGFGISGNVTLINSKFTFLTSVGPRNTGLFLQPDVTGNASIYYQRGKFEGRVSYNYIGGFLETINDTIPNADQYWKGRTTFDANISYRILRQVTLYAEGQNLSDAGRREVVGPGRSFLQEAAEYGRTFFLGATVSF